MHSSYYYAASPDTDQHPQHPAVPAAPQPYYVQDPPHSYMPEQYDPSQYYTQYPVPGQYHYQYPEYEADDTTHLTLPPASPAVGRAPPTKSRRADPSDDHTDMPRSTKGASKQRRDLINTEVNNMRDMLPLPESARQRLSQLQIMSLACCFIRKSNYFSHIFVKGGTFNHETHFQFSQALNGFLLITTQDGKLLYISENITEYLGHSMVDMMTQGDSLYDIIDKRDHGTVQAQLQTGQLVHNTAADNNATSDEKTFFCRMNVARSFRRQTGFGDNKMMHVRGHFIQSVSGGEPCVNQPVFMAVCSPLVTPDTKEPALLNNTMVFQSVHGLDLKFIEISHTGEQHLGYSEQEVYGRSLYELLHPEDLQEAKEKHTLLIQSSHEMGCMLTVRVQNQAGYWVWVHMIMHVRQPFVCDNAEPAIICTSHVIRASEAQHFKMQSQQFSSHVASSPEYLSQDLTPPQSITPVCVEPKTNNAPHNYMGSLQATEEAGAYYGHIGVAITPVSGSGMGQCDPLEQAHLVGTHSAYNNGYEAANSLDDMQRVKHADVMNRLKRKMDQQPCKPSKKPRVVEERDHSHRTLSSMPHSVPLVSNFTETFSGNGQSSGGGLQVMSAPYQFAQLSTAGVNCKRDVEVFEKFLSLASHKTPDITLPLSPESQMSDNSPEMTSLSICVESSDNAVVPSSLLTPDASPACSPVQTNHGSPLMQEQLNTELSMYSGPDYKKSEIISEGEDLPFLDLPMVEHILASIEGPTGKLPPPYVAGSPEELGGDVEPLTVDKVPSSLPGHSADDLLAVTDDEFRAMMSDAFQGIVHKEGCRDVMTSLEAAQLPTPSEDFMHELHQLTEKLASSPSHGEDSLISSSLLNQTL